MIPLVTQIGPHHRGCAFDLGGRAFRDFLSVVEHNDTIAQAHDHPHIVLDEKYADPLVITQSAHRVGNTAAFQRVHPGRGLVEKK